MSCHGCRALRKACAEHCTLRDSLQWIESPESQANATLFLAKFYGRTGLIDLLNDGPAHLRPEIFRSLLYEACGRKIDRVHGSIGLICSGNWRRCQTAVESVLRSGWPQVPGEPAALLGHARARTGVKRYAEPEVNYVATGFRGEPEAKFTITGWDTELYRAASDNSFSAEKVEPDFLNRDQKPVCGSKPGSQSGDQNWLDLTLGVNPVRKMYNSTGIIDGQTWIGNAES